MAGRRIVSFLPSGTEMAYALGLGDQLVGVTHECDFPPEARSKPKVVRNALPIEAMSDREIDAAVSARVKEGESLYVIDHALVRELRPDLIITQSLCDVCAPSSAEIDQLVADLPNRPEILWMTPHSLGEIDDNLRALGEACGRTAEAEALIAKGRSRLDAVAARRRGLPRPRVFCMEWLDPVYCSGHWVPEMVRIAGGEDRLSREGALSVRLEFEDVRAFAPEVLILMPCGFDLAKTVEHARSLSAYPGWETLPAVRNGRVYAVDANGYFARPGPRVVEGVELLAHLIHPDRFDWTGAPEAYRPLDLARETAPLRASPPSATAGLDRSPGPPRFQYRQRRTTT